MSFTYSGKPFPETCSSFLERALAGEAQALEELARKYWPAIYGSIAKRMRDYGQDQDKWGESAEDLTQEVVREICLPGNLASWAEVKGSFRAWVLGIVNHVVTGRWRRMMTAKRGGGVAHVQIDDLSGLPDGSPSSEEVLNLEWAKITLSSARESVRTEWESKGKAAEFDRLIGLAMLGRHSDETHLEVATAMEITRAAVGGRVARLWDDVKYAALFECRKTCGSDEEAQEELRQLMAFIRDGGKQKKSRSKEPGSANH